MNGKAFLLAGIAAGVYGGEAICFSKRSLYF